MSPISTTAEAGDKTEAGSFQVDRVRRDFPILARVINGKPLVYLDNANTSQKPEPVIEATNHFYRHWNANVHRGVHTLSEEASAGYEGARDRVRSFINAEHEREIVFVRGTTEAINLVVQSHVRPLLDTGKEILISHIEHHSNIVPWQIVCEQTGAHLKVVPVNDLGELDMEAFDRLLNDRTAIVAINHVSNAIGTINPVREIVEKAHAVGVPVLLDGAQAMPHMNVDVRQLGCDFYAFSSHKMFGPTGIGVLYGRAELLERMPPYQGGGDMIRSVTFEKTLYNELPYKFEAGTPNVAGAIGLHAAMDYLERIDMDRVAAYEKELLAYGTQVLSALPGLQIIGAAREKASVLSFVLEHAHPHDAGTVLNDLGIAVRTGHHCAQPLMARFDVPATIRASLAFYNTKEEIDFLAEGLERVHRLFAL